MLFLVSPSTTGILPCQWQVLFLFLIIIIIFYLFYLTVLGVSGGMWDLVP